MIQIQQLDELAHNLNQLGILMFSKMDNNRFIFCNESLAAFAELESPKQIDGKKDDDLIWRDQSDMFVAEDIFVRKGGQLINSYQRLISIKNVVTDILQSKVKLVNSSGECIGIVGTAIDITNQGSAAIKPQGLSNAYDEKTGRFYLGEQFANQYLTRKEYIVFKQVVLGKTAREIAKNFEQSQRTIEQHITQIKTKLNCKHKHELIQFALTHPWLRLL